MSIIKIIVVVLLLVIIASMGSALFYLVRDKGEGKRVVNALTVRIVLSLTAFGILMIAYMLGVVSPNA